MCPEGLLEVHVVLPDYNYWGTMGSFCRGSLRRWRASHPTDFRSIGLGLLVRGVLSHGFACRALGTARAKTLLRVAGSCGGPNDATRVD